jgi:hypothetical protein
MGALILCVAMLLKMFEQQPAQENPDTQPPTHTTPRLAPLPADTALTAPPANDLPCIVFLCPTHRSTPPFPPETLLEELLQHARGAFLIRVEKASAKSADAGLDTRAVPPAILVLNADGSLRRVLDATAEAADVLAAVGIETHKPEGNSQEGKP